MKRILGTILIGMFSTSLFASTKSEYESEFKKTMGKVIEILEAPGITMPRELELIRVYPLKYDAEFAEVEMKRKTLKDKFGRVKCALNFPMEKRIEFNKECWEKLENNDEMKLVFVFHEYLGLSEQEIDNYELSSLIVAPYKKLLEIKAENARREIEKKEALLAENIPKFKARINEALKNVEYLKGNLEKIAPMFKDKEITIQYMRNNPSEFYDMALIDMKDIIKAYELETETITTLESYYTKINNICKDFGFSNYKNGYIRADLTTAFVKKTIMFDKELSYKRNLETYNEIVYGRYDRIICLR